MTVALTGIAAVDLGSIYKCPKEDYRSALYFPAYCSKGNFYNVIISSHYLFYFIFPDPYAAPRIAQAAWGIIIASSIQLVASACSIFICMRIIYNSESGPDPAVITF